MRPGSILAAAVLSTLPVLAQAATTTTIFFDDFATEVAAATTTVSITNYSPLANWNITDGAVDLFTDGGFALPCGSAGCLDMDGSISNAARLESKTAFSFTAGKTYTLTLAIAGKNGSAAESLTFGVLGAHSAPISSPAGTSGAGTYDLSFIALSDFAQVIFVDHAGGDSRGLLLDSVKLTETAPTPAVPLPAGLPLLAAALAGFGLARRRRG